MSDSKSFGLHLPWFFDNINFNQILNFEFLTVLFQADPWVCAHRGHSTTSCGFTFSEFFEIGREALAEGTGGCVFA